MKIYQNKISVGTLSSGLDLSIPVTTVESGKPGPVVYIQSGIHGGEVTAWVLRDLIRYLKINGFCSGKLIITTCANPLSWLQRSYYYTHGKFNAYNGVDWNRLFPGNENTDAGSRIAKVLFSIAQSADVVIDLHTARRSFPFSIYTLQTPIELVKAVGFEYNQLLDVKAKASYSGTLNCQLDVAGIPSITLECGSHDSCNLEDNDYCLKGVLRLLKFYKMIEQDHRFDYQLLTFEKTKKMYANHGGYVQYNFDVKDAIARGDVIYTILDPNNVEAETEVISDSNFLMLKRVPTHIVNFGDETIEVVEKSSLSYL